MSLELPALSIADSLKTRLEKRRPGWEGPFEENHVRFAECLALGIAKHLLDELRNIIRNPYYQTVNSQNKLHHYIHLNITDNNVAVNIKKYVGEEGAQLEPFNEWLEKYAIENKKTDHRYYDFYDDLDHGRADKNYFMNLMSMVGKVAENRLKEVFAEFKSDPDHRALQFKVEWIQNDEKIISNPSDFNDNYLKIELWLDDINNPVQIERNLSLIDQHRIRKIQRQKIQMRNTCVFICAVIVVLFAFIYNVPPRRIRH